MIENIVGRNCCFYIVVGFSLFKEECCTSPIVGDQQIAQIISILSVLCNFVSCTGWISVYRHIAAGNTGLIRISISLQNMDWDTLLVVVQTCCIGILAVGEIDLDVFVPAVCRNLNDFVTLLSGIYLGENIPLFFCFFNIVGIGLTVFVENGQIVPLGCGAGVRGIQRLAYLYQLIDRSWSTGPGIAIECDRNGLTGSS